MANEILLSTDETKTRCKIGQGGGCCIFLAFTPGEGFTCERNGTLHDQIMARHRSGEMVAASINCTGAPEFKQEE